MEPNRYAVPLDSLDTVRVDAAQQVEVQPVTQPQHEAFAGLAADLDGGADADAD